MWCKGTLFHEKRWQNTRHFWQQMVQTDDTNGEEGVFLAERSFFLRSGGGGMSRVEEKVKKKEIVCFVFAYLCRRKRKTNHRWRN